MVPAKIDPTRYLGLRQPQKAHAQRGLARTGLTHNSQGLALTQLQIERLYSNQSIATKPAPANGKTARQPLCIEHHGRIRRCGINQAARPAVDQASRVGMGRLCEHLRSRAELDQVPALHHRNTVGKLSNQRQVVRDQQHRHTEFLLQRIEQCNDLALNGDIKRRGGFVSNQEPRPAGKRHGNQNPLSLAARDFMRISSRAAFGIADLCSGEERLCLAQGLTAAQPLMTLEQFSDLIARGEQRVERAHRLLKNDRNVSPPDPAHIGQVGGQQVTAIEHDASGVVRIRVEPQHRQRGDGLTRTRLANQREPFPLSD